MKQLFCALLLFFTMFCNSAMLQARHLIGGEITYECLGYVNNDPSTNRMIYQFTMIIYRDCLGGGADFDSGPTSFSPAHVTLFRGDNPNWIDAYWLDAPVVTDIEAIPGNSCVVVPTNICVEQGVYTFPLVELDVIDESYHLVYQRCCRNNTINNIIEPGASGATYTLELTPAAQASCNNSPTFNDFPPILICANQDFTFDHSATDAEGDQLIYEFCAPLLGGGPNTGNPNGLDGVAPDPDAPPPFDEVNFAVPDFTFLDPLGTVSPVSINTNTGLITGVPVLPGQFVVGVCVSEFRGGELLSTIRRDFQFNVTNCEVTVFADIQEDEIINGRDYVLNSCGVSTIDFVNQSFQEENIDEYRWEFVRDGQNIDVFNEWNPTIEFPGPGQYGGRLILNPGEDCSDTATIFVNIFPEIDADFSFEYDTCIAGPVEFTDLSFSGFDGITDWDWQFGDGDTSAMINPAHVYRDPGNFPVRLQVTDSNGCTDVAEQEVSYFPVPAIIVVAPSTFIGCAPADIFFNNLSEPIDETYSLLWDFGDGGISEAISPTYRYQEPGVYSVGVQIVSPIGCETDTLFTDLIEATEPPTAAFSFSPETTDNFAPEIMFTDRSMGASRWFWNFDGKATSINPNPSYVFPDTGQQLVTLIVEDGLRCKDTTVAIVDIIPTFTYFLPNAFTPNADAVNDTFEGKGFLVGISDFEMQIWNRWGELVFASSSPEAGWNGRKNNSGQLAPPGVYVCQVTFKGPRGEPYQNRSMITLIR
ncbi:MAG: PKD domain-containing protein [Bacteroidota bacterium]